MVNRVGTRVVLPIGLVLSGVAVLLYTRLPVHGSYAADLLPGFLLTGIGLGLAFVPDSIAALTGARGDEAGAASGLINTSQQIGGAVGIAAITTIATTASTNFAHTHASLGALLPAISLVHGFQVAFYVLAGVLFGAAVLAPRSSGPRWRAPRPAPYGAGSRAGTRAARRAPSPRPVRVLGLVPVSVTGTGSSAYHRSLFRAAQEQAPAGMMIDEFDIGALPAYPGGDDGPAGDAEPVQVARLRSALRRSEAVLVATPQYDRAAGAAMRNAFAWAASAAVTPCPVANRSPSWGPRATSATCARRRPSFATRWATGRRRRRRLPGDLELRARRRPAGRAPVRARSASRCAACSPHSRRPRSPPDRRSRADRRGRQRRPPLPPAATPRIIGAGLLLKDPERGPAWNSSASSAASRGRRSSARSPAWSRGADDRGAPRPAHRHDACLLVGARHQRGDVLRQDRLGARRGARRARPRGLLLLPREGLRRRRRATRTRCCRAAACSAAVPWCSPTSSRWPAFHAVVTYPGRATSCGRQTSLRTCCRKGSARPWSSAAAPRALPGLEHLEVCCNHMLPAGASMAHPHFQVFGGPAVPWLVRRSGTVRRPSCRARRLVLATPGRQETATGERFVAARDGVTWLAAFAPTAAAR